MRNFRLLDTGPETYRSYSAQLENAHPRMVGTKNLLKGRQRSFLEWLGLRETTSLHEFDGP